MNNQLKARNTVSIAGGGIRTRVKRLMRPLSNHYSTPVYKQPPMEALSVTTQLSHQRAAVIGGCRNRTYQAVGQVIYSHPILLK